MEARPAEFMISSDSPPSSSQAPRSMALVAELERELTRERTTAALRAKRAKGERQGPPPKLDPALRGWIVREVEAGRSKKRLARDLNERGVPTATGRGRWYPSTTLAVCRSVAYERELTAAAAGARPAPCAARR